MINDKYFYFKDMLYEKSINSYEKIEVIYKSLV